MPAASRSSPRAQRAPPAAAAPRRALLLLGLGLCCAALGWNRWSLGWLLSSDGELGGLAPNLSLAAGQAALFCLGTALLRRPGDGRLERALSPAAWNALGGLALWTGLLGGALTLAPFLRSESAAREAQLVADLFDGEQRDARLCEVLAPLLGELADGWLDALPDPDGALLVAPALEAPPAASEGGAGARPAERSWSERLRRLELARGPERSAGAVPVALLEPLEQRGTRLLDGRARLLDTAFEARAGPGPDAARARVELTGRVGGSRAGGSTWELAAARIELDFTAPRAEDPARTTWRLTALRVLAAELSSAPQAPFAVAAGLALPAGVSCADVCLADLDGDGRADLYVASSAGPGLALLERGAEDQAGRYEERGRALGLDLPGPLLGAAAADFDGDGRDELLVARAGAPALWLAADERGVFRSRGAPDWPADVTSIAVGDVDGDGWLDAVLGVGPPLAPEDLDWDPDWREGGLPRVRAGPACVLLRNPGGTGLEASAPVEPSAFAGRARQVALCDWDGDGDLDLCLVLDLQGARWFENDGAGGFRAAPSSFAPLLGAGLCAVAFGDHDGDGRADLFALRAAEPGGARALERLGSEPPEAGGALFWNAGAGFQRVLGAEAEALEDAPGSGRGAFVDVDGDGRLDLSVGGGPGGTRGAEWWRRARCGAEGERLEDPRARATYALRARSAPPAPPAAPEPPALFLNADRGGPRFELAAGLAPAAGAAPARVLAWSDPDRDGLPDALVLESGAQGEALTWHSSRVAEPGARRPRALAVRLEGGARGGEADGEPWSPRGGHGALLEVALGAEPGRAGEGREARDGAGAGRTLWRVHRAAELQGGAGGDLTLLGLGDARVAQVLRVHWPSGRVQEAYDVPAGALVTFWEDPAGSPTGAAATLAPYRRRALVGPAADPLLQIGARATTIDAGQGPDPDVPAPGARSAAPPGQQP